MEIFHNRPLFLCETVFVAGCLSAAFFGKSFTVGVIVIGAILSLIVLFCYLQKKTAKRLIFLLCALGVFLSGTDFLLRYWGRNEKNESYIGQTLDLEGTVIERMSGTTYNGKFAFRVRTMNGKRKSAKVIVECAYATSAQCGDFLRLTVTPRAFTDDDDYDEKLQITSDGYDFICVCEGSEECTFLGERKTLSGAVHHLRDVLTGKLLNALGRENGGMASALLLGDRSHVSSVDKLHFSRVGVSHLLALSGFHATLIVLFLNLILRGMRVPFVPRLIVTAVLMVSYLFLTGLSPSTIRAVLMICTLEVGWIIRREYDSLTALGGILCAILFISPYAVHDVSLWLSFLATAGIVIFVPLAEPFTLKLRKRFKGIPLAILMDLWNGTFAGICAVVAIQLFSAWTFGSISILSVPLTLFYTVPVGTVLALSAVILVIPIQPLVEADWAVLTFLRRSVQLFSEPEGIFQVCTDWVSYAILMVMTASLILGAVLKIRKKGWFVLPPILWCAAFLSCLIYPSVMNRTASADYVNTTSGDLLFFSQKGQCVAVNFTDGLASGANALRDLAKENHCGEIDRLIFTHYHNRDTNFLVSLSGKELVRELWLPEPINETERAIAERIVEVAEEIGIHCYVGSPEEILDGLELEYNLHTEAMSNRHTGLLFTVDWNGKKLTYLNASVPDTALSDIADAQTVDTDVLIIGESGYKKAGNKHLLPAPRPDCPVVYSTEGSEKLFEVPPNGRVAESYHFSFP